MDMMSGRTAGLTARLPVLNTLTVGAASMSNANPTIIVRDVPGWLGYGASADGCAWSRWGAGGHRRRLTDSWKPLSPKLANTGYHCVTLSIAGKRRHVAVHTLVLEAFVGSAPFAGCECRHLNGDRTDNRLENLAWGTHRENTDDRLSHGTSTMGEDHHLARLTEDSVREIRQLHQDGVPGTELASRFGMSTATISQVVRRYTWKHVV